MSDLAPCPFCRYEKPKVNSNKKLHGFTGFDHRVERHSKYIQCPRCFARGGLAAGLVIVSPLGDIPLPSWATTDEALEEKAIKRWNRRASDLVKANLWFQAVRE